VLYHSPSNRARPRGKTSRKGDLDHNPGSRINVTRREKKSRRKTRGCETEVKESYLFEKRAPEAEKTKKAGKTGKHGRESDHAEEKKRGRTRKISAKPATGTEGKTIRQKKPEKDPGL